MYIWIFTQQNVLHFFVFSKFLITVFFASIKIFFKRIIVSFQSIEKQFYAMKQLLCMYNTVLHAAYLKATLKCDIIQWKWKPNINVI